MFPLLSRLLDTFRARAAAGRAWLERRALWLVPAAFGAGAVLGAFVAAAMALG
jgi:hypothetical protein